MRSHATNQTPDLDNAITLYREALDLQRTPDTSRISTLLSLSAVLIKRFGRIGGLRDMLDGSSLLNETLKGDEEAEKIFDSASSALSRFGYMSQIPDIDKAMSLLHQVLLLRLWPHPKRSPSIANLATALLMRFEKTGQLPDLK